jgi:hypothetical protein
MQMRLFQWILSISLLLAALPAFTSSASAAEFRLSPALVVNQIYNDNLYNDDDNRISEFITRAMPTLLFDYEAARLVAMLSYSLDFRYYARGERGNETTHAATAKGLATLVENYLFLEVINEYGRVSADPARDFREESLFLGQVDRNVFSASPYLQIPLTTRISLQPGYIYTRTDYDEGVDRESHTLFTTLSWEVRQNLTFEAGANYTREYTDLLDFEKRDVWGGLRYQYNNAGLVFASVGNIWTDWDNGIDQQNVFWNVGLTHDLRYAVATVVSGVSYTDDPQGTILRKENYTIAAKRDFSRGDLELSAYRNDYRDGLTDLLETRIYGGRGKLRYELTPRTEGILALALEEFDRRLERTERERFIGNIGFYYLLAEHISSGLSYFHVRSHSIQLPDDRYRTNRVILELKAVF